MKKLSLIVAILAAAAVLAPARGEAQVVEQLCDPSWQNCQTQILSLINNETVEIDIGLWFMTDSTFSTPIIKKWQAGVPVRILMDPREFAQGTQQAIDDQTIMNQLQAAGIPMRKRIASGIEHWKAMIFAGQNTVYFGSANFSSYAFYPIQPYVNYTDEIVYFTNDLSIVQSFQTKFDNAWIDTANYANYANVPPTLTRSYPISTIDPEMNFVPDQSYATRSVNEYNKETQKIDADMFRITDQRHTNAIIAAAGRGIPIRLIVDPGQYRTVARLWDAWNVDRLYMTPGIVVRQTAHQGENHGKLVLLYGLGESIFGSSNWSSPSGDSQHEHNYFTKKSTLFTWLQSYFERRWNNSNPVGAVETVPFTPLPPDKPVYKTPASGATGLPTSGVQLVWDGGPWGQLYDIYFGASPTPPLYASNQNLGPDDPANPKLQSVSLPGLLPGTTYYWQIVSKTMANKTATGPVWSFTTSGTAGSAALPSPWLDGDIGAVGIVGSASYTNPTFSVAGSGADIWGTADAFHYVYQSLNGDGSLVARVASVQSNVNSWSKGGVMIRNTLDPSSAFAFMLVSAAKGTAFHYRTAFGATATSVAGTTTAAPEWVKIVRSGSTITGYQSPDGSTWQQIGSATISMATTVYIGLAVTSHDNTQLCTATFDNVSAGGNVGTGPPGMPSSPTPSTGATGVGTRPTLTWASTGATSYDVAVGTTNPPATVATGIATASYTPSPLNTSTTYYWQITAHNSGGTTAGPVWSFTTASGVPAPWTDGDVGLVGVAGSATYSNGVFSVSGSGADIWGTADAFNWVYQSISGDGQLVARVASIQNIASWSKAGVMVRETLDPASAYALMLVSSGKGTAFQYRTAAGASAAGVTGTTGTAAPLWVKIVRSGTTITGYQSSDGVTWRQIGSATFTMASNVYIGLAVSSHDNTRLCTTTFDNVALTGSAGTSAPGTPSSPVPANGATGVSLNPTLTWTATGATTYDVAFGTTNPPPVVSQGQSTASYIPGALVANTKYFWQITASNNSGTTAGPVWSFTTLAGLPSPWQDGDIGAVGVTGSAAYNNGVFSVSGSGSDIWGSADAFHFVYQPLTGDGQLIARVASVQNVSSWTKAGVMIRDTLNPNSAYALMLVSAAKGTALQYRASTGALASNIAGTSATAPLWVKIVRTGSTFSGYQSADGNTWTLIGTATVSMGSTVQIGLAVTSHNNTALATATFDSVQ